MIATGPTVGESEADSCHGGFGPAGLFCIFLIVPWLLCALYDSTEKTILFLCLHYFLKLQKNIKEQ